MIEPLYEVLRIVDGDRTPTMGLVYAKLEVAKKRIIAESPKYSHMFIDIIEDRWDRQMSRDLHMAGEWWLSYGRTSPTLREIAIRVLSKTSSSSGCERNWSTFALIHTKVRNILSHRRLDNLVHVHYNMRLRLKHVQMDAKKGDGDYDPTYMSYLRDDEDPMVS
ncbi:hypothetical protein Taro_029848 [Colocasia esculenta]|uniref:HAT C-terminal dimerisation domain-containing protein n=1 Tax=Colocasia esculenta TaxID=4460 RepID=A0A843VYE9_COLES|nr:hypothetical protein [Colocasia esculenta]